MKGTISGKVITEGKPMVVEDIYSEPLYHYIDIARKANLKSLLSAPILAGDKAVGVFNAHTTTPHRFQDWEVNLLSAFAAQAGAAIEINKTLRRLILLHNYAETLTQADDFAEIVDRVVKRTRDAYNADITGLWLYDSATDSFYHGASCGLSPEEVEKALPRLKGMSNQIISTKEPIIIPDIRMSTPGTVNPHAIEVGGKAIAGLPLLVGTRPVGVLYVDFLQPHYYTSEEVETLQAMANLAAVAVDNARGMEARRQFLVNVTHDLKAPLAAMDAQLQMLNLFGFDPGRFKNTYGETRRLIQLVDSLLGLLRAEYAAKPVRFEEVKLVEILSNIEVVWSALIKMRGLTMHVEVAPGAEVVYSDEERVRCIIFNLIDNAVKFAKKGGYVCVQATGNECSFTITVENDGHGMVPELVEQLRLKRNQTPEPPWVEMETGVGYAAIRRFVADLGGEVDIQSSDKGTKVIVTLPMLQRETMSQERRID
jgi:signal transduction histidine kinase